MSDSFLNDYLRTRSRVDQLERIESSGGGGAVYLTLTRTTVQVITTGAGTILEWQSEERGNGITWSGSAITIPDDGYYAVDVSFFANTSVAGNLIVNGVFVGRMTMFNGSGAGQRLSALRYFSTSDVMEILVIGNTSVNMTVRAYGTDRESPFLHIVKVA